MVLSRPLFSAHAKVSPTRSSTTPCRGQVAGTTPGNYSVYIDDGTGATPSSTVALVYANIDAVNGFTIEFYVQAATPIVANISEEIAIASGYSFATVQSLIAERFGKRMGRLLGVGRLVPVLPSGASVLRRFERRN